MHDELRMALSIALTVLAFLISIGVLSIALNPERQRARRSDGR